MQAGSFEATHHFLHFQRILWEFEIEGFTLIACLNTPVAVVMKDGFGDPRNTSGVRPAASSDQPANCAEEVICTDTTP